MDEWFVCLFVLILVIIIVRKLFRYWWCCWQLKNKVKRKLQEEKVEVYIYKQRRTYIDDNGYKRYKNNNRLVHREKAYKYIYCKSNRIKYPLRFRSYDIHHIDRNKLNNKIENLELLTRKQHKKKHKII